jgi:hypothetical protein
MTVEDRQLASGKYIVTARVRDDKEGIWVCTLWDEEAASFRSRGLQGQRVYMEGGLRDENCISVKFYDVHRHATPQPPKETVVQREYDPVVTVTEHDATRVKVVFLEPNGLRTYQIRPKSNFVKVNGSWECMIDYCIRILGGDGVREYFRLHPGQKVTVQPNVIQIENTLFESAKNYREKLMAMVTDCMKHNGDFVETHDGTELAA